MYKKKLEFFYTKQQQSTKEHKRAQKSTKEHKRAQKSTKEHKRAQKSTKEHKMGIILSCDTLKNRRNLRSKKDKIKQAHVEQEEEEEEEEHNYDCVICLQTMEQQDIHTTECLHTFHTSCLGLWLRQKQTCPLCRTQQLPAIAPPKMQIGLTYDIHRANVLGLTYTNGTLSEIFMVNNMTCYRFTFQEPSMMQYVFFDSFYTFVLRA